jgi:hypothetical protein
MIIAILIYICQYSEFIEIISALIFGFRVYNRVGGGD